MTNEQNDAQERDIPVPPGGGAWTFDETNWAWVSNTPAQTADVAAAAADQTSLTFKQEQ